MIYKTGTAAPGQYAYLDAGYFRKLFESEISPFFESGVPRPDFGELKRLLQVDRVFYYDCLSDTDEDGEPLKIQKLDYDQVLKTDGYLPKLGTLSGKGRKKLRQKEVDVQLAVDMLTHAYDGLIGEAVLVSGDLDFRPVLNALIARGVYVRLVFDPMSVSQDLFTASDVRTVIDRRFLYKCLSPKTQEENPFPEQATWGQLPPGRIMKRGHAKDRNLLLIEHDNKFVAIFADTLDAYSHPRVDQLLNRYLPVLLPDIKWTDHLD